MSSLVGNWFWPVMMVFCSVQMILYAYYRFVKGYTPTRVVSIILGEKESAGKGNSKEDVKKEREP